MESRLRIPVLALLGVGVTLSCSQPARAQQAACSANAANSTTNVYPYPYNSGNPGSILTCGQTVTSGNTPLYNYEGIQYAQQSRWQTSTVLSLPPAGGAVSQITPGPVCPQANPSNSQALSNQSEDCLYLNIWTPQINPATATKLLPVMVFIHGGAFVSGAGSVPMYNGAALAAAGNMVVVTINYRLGALGFLTQYNGSDSKASLTIGGNFGILDQRNAIQWVNTNIRSFGGDPTRITLAGESAGAMSVGLHTFAMGNSSNFSQAIMESNPLGLYYMSPSQDFADHSRPFINHLCSVWKDRISQAGAKSIVCGEYTNPNSWTSQPQMPVLVADVLNAQGMSSSACSITNWIACGAELSRVSLTWSPVVDKVNILSQPLAASGNSKPILMGTNRNEGNVFIGLFTMKYPDVGGVIDGSNIVAAPAYTGILTGMFNAVDAVTIPLNHPRYQAGTYSFLPTLPNKYSVSPTEQALSQVVTDYLFNAPNYYLADDIATQTTPVYTYSFQQNPYFDLYGPAANDFCWPSDSFVCHANELPYVFNTLSTVPAAGAYKVSAADQYLSNFMTQMWADFVNQTPPPGISPYSSTASAPVAVLAYTNNNAPMSSSDLTYTNIESSIYYASLWKKIIQTKFNIQTVKAPENKSSSK